MPVRSWPRSVDADLSPEARLAADAFRAVGPTLAASVRGCAGGRELALAGFAVDVDVAAQLDVSEVVPVLEDGRFRDASSPGSPSTAPAR